MVEGSRRLAPRALLRARWLGAIALTLVLALASCGGDDSSDGDGSSSGGQAASGDSGKPLAGETVKFGLIAPFTGPFAANGKAAKLGYEAGIDYLNAGNSASGAQFELVARDDGGDPTKSVTIIRELANEGVKGLATTTTPGSGIAVQPVVNQMRIVDFTGGPGVSEEASATQKFPWVFNVGLDPVQYTFAHFDYLVDTLKQTRVGEIYQADPNGLFFHKGAQVEADKRGVEVIAKSFQTAQQDVTAQLRSIKDSGVETLMVYAYGTPLAVVTSSLGKLGWKPTVLTVLGAADPGQIELMEKATPGITKTMIAGPIGKAFISPESGAPPSTELGKAWATSTKKIAGRELNGSDFQGIQGFNSVIALDQALELAGSTDSEKLADAMDEGPIELTDGPAPWSSDGRRTGFENDRLGVFVVGSDYSAGTALRPGEEAE